MAVAAARPLRQGAEVRGVAVVHDGERARDGAAAVLAAALDLGAEVPVELVPGGPATAAERLGAARPGELVIGVEGGDRRGGAGAAAALLGAGEGIRGAGRSRAALPVEAALAAHDPRLVRERAWRPLLSSLRGGDGFHVVGIPAAPAAAFGAESAAGALAGAAGVIDLLAAMVEADRGGRVVGVEGGRAAALDLGELRADVHRAGRRGLVDLPRAAAPGEIPISLSGYDRAFPARVGFKAARCECGELSLPPRRHCLRCGRQGATTLVELPRRASVYSVVTVHAPIPGRAVPYSLAVVELAGVPLRLLAPVTDARPGTTAIGCLGALVLRRVADREGVPDYGYSFQPDEEETG